MDATPGARKDSKRTPSHIGYEIQISNHYKDKFPTGSIYSFQAAKAGSQHDDDWNALDIEVRDALIRVKLNGAVVAEHAGDPARGKEGPIGLQLHDNNSVVMFRNIRIREFRIREFRIREFRIRELKKATASPSAGSR